MLPDGAKHEQVVVARDEAIGAADYCRLKDLVVVGIANAHWLAGDRDLLSRRVEQSQELLELRWAG